MTTKDSKNSIVNYIESIEKSYKSATLVYETMLEFFFNLDRLPIHFVPMKKGSSLTRARYKSADENFSNPEEFSYPPEEYVQSFSRVNRPRQSLFYAGETEHTCLAEMMRFWGEEFDIGDKIKVAMGRWRLIKDIKLIIIPDPNNKSDLNQIVVKRLGSDALKFWSYMSKKFKTTGKEEKYIYELTSAFSNSIYLNLKRNDSSICGFIYSSVQSPNNLNVALEKELIDSKILVPEQYAEMQCARIGYDNRKLPYYSEVIGSRKQGVLKNGMIKWK
jgi:hypothetical protein